MKNEFLHSLRDMSVDVVEIIADWHQSSSGNRFGFLEQLKSTQLQASDTSFRVLQPSVVDLRQVRDGDYLTWIGVDHQDCESGSGQDDESEEDWEDNETIRSGILINGSR